MAAQTKRYKTVSEESSKGRQLSSLFSIISSNLLLATQVLSPEYKIKAVQELETLSRNARLLAKELMSDSCDLTKEDLTQRISYLKQRMLDLVIDLNDDLSKIDSCKHANHSKIEDLILAKRLLRDSQRGLVTIQD